jgi:hypothetical protein
MKPTETLSENGEENTSPLILQRWNCLYPKHILRKKNLQTNISLEHQKVLDKISINGT